MKTFRQTHCKVVAIALLMLVLGFVSSDSTYAASTITVNSTADTTANDGVCTLREAITAANNDTASGAAAGECTAGSGADTIEFAITGTADFTNNSQDGYTISPTSELPDITETVTIDGYSQSGAQANTAIAPNPLNGTLLIELKGDSAGVVSAALRFTDDSNDSTVKGLVINDFGTTGDAFVVLADDLTVQGNYIGTDPSGFTAHPNRVGLTAEPTGNPESGHGALVGGLNPEDRNLISGNTAASGAATAAYPGTGWVLQGNLVGLAADGLTSIPNSTLDGSGAFSIDDCQDVLVGGDQPGAINVIGGSLGHGIAPNNASNVRIIGNYIGLGYDGTTVIDNVHPGHYGSGLTFGGDTDITVRDNKIVGWSGGGVYISESDSNFTISNNEIHDVGYGGITVQGTQMNIDNNIVYNSGFFNFIIGSFSAYQPQTDSISLTANKIGVKHDGNPGDNNSAGISIFGDPTNVTIGGAGSDEGNEIAYNKQGGIMIYSFSSPTLSLAVDVQKVTILGNSIHSNEPDSSGSFADGGLGIDLFTNIDIDGNLTDDITSDVGPTLNDPQDSDTGTNNYINFPVLNSVVQDSTQATINFNLDVADSPVDQYRVEFFANDEADPSGYGEGQTFLGSATVANGTGQQASLTLPAGTDLTNKSISATTTAIDATTDSGFGSTSEFSQIVLATSTTTSISDGLAGTGENTALIALVAVLTLSGGLVGVTKVKYLK